MRSYCLFLSILLIPPLITSVSDNNEVDCPTKLL